MILTFPWPSKALSPNSRAHWATKAKAASKYKDDCFWLCYDADTKGREWWEGEVYSAVLCIMFHPPSKRRADLDNMLASFKYGIDAIASYTMLDDSNFSLVIAKGDPVKNGAVKVEIQKKNRKGVLLP